MYKYKCVTGYENTTRAFFVGEGEYDIPIIEPTKITENNFIGFNEVLSSKQNNYGVHFFLDDYQFQRLWNTPDKYIEMLKRLKPETVIFYGKVPEECQGNIINIKSFQEKFRGVK